MRRIENILLSRVPVPVWIVVVLLTLAAAGTVVFGALVESVRGCGCAMPRVCPRVPEPGGSPS